MNQFLLCGYFAWPDMVSKPSSQNSCNSLHCCCCGLYASLSYAFLFMNTGPICHMHFYFWMLALSVICIFISEHWPSSSYAFWFLNAIPERCLKVQLSAIRTKSTRIRGAWRYSKVWKSNSTVCGHIPERSLDDWPPTHCRHPYPLGMMPICSLHYYLLETKPLRDLHENRFFLL